MARTKRSVIIEFFPDVDWIHTLEDYVVHRELDSTMIAYILGAWIVFAACHGLRALSRRNVSRSAKKDDP